MIAWNILMWFVFQFWYNVFDEYEHFLFKTYGFTKVDYDFIVTMDIPQITLNFGLLNITIDFFFLLG